MIGILAAAAVALSGSDPATYWSKTVLTYGPPADLRKHKPLAVACGFPRAHLRAFQTRDIPTQTPNPRWVILDAGTEAKPGTPPYECFMDRVVRPGLRNKSE